MSTYEFSDHVRREMRSLGTTLPFVFTAHPVVGMPPEALYESYIEGNDPLTNKRVIDEIVDALTKNRGPAQSDSVTTCRGGFRSDQDNQASCPPLTQHLPLEPDTEDNLHRLFYERGWTDGNPIILPTQDRVLQMLTGTGRGPDELVGETFLIDTKEVLTYTVTDIAVIAVMAGARPEYLPVILATAAAKHSALTPSTTPFANMLLVNGPIRDEVGMNSGLAAFSPWNQANSVIGRAWTLMSLCWGFARPKLTLWSSQGNNLIFNNMCVAENEEGSVWTPFHVQKGFRREESVVSIFRGWNVLSSLHAAANRSIGEELSIQLSYIPALNSCATIIMDPLVARQLKDTEGFQTKESFSLWLSQHARIEAGRYWGTDYIDMLVTSQAENGVEPYASWKKLAEDELIPHYNNPDNINIVVVGGETSPLWKTTDYVHRESVSVDYWRPEQSTAGCDNGTCGVPDPPVDYD